MIEFWVGWTAAAPTPGPHSQQRAASTARRGRAAGSNLELGIALAHGHVLAAIDQARIDAGLPRRANSGWGWARTRLRRARRLLPRHADHALPVCAG